jgi:soluble lytic murein transglycosylase-like protein
MLAALTLSLLLHTSGELSAWRQDWSARIEATGYMPTVELLIEHHGMMELHRRRVLVMPPEPRTVRPVAAGVEQWRTLVAAYFAPEHVEAALRVMACESAGDPDARNPSGASGLFQHMVRYWPERAAKAGWAGASVFDPAANVAVAAWLSDGGADWSHWTCRP